MGRVLIISVLLLTVVIATIAVSINNRREESPEVVAKGLAHIKAKSLSNEALKYGINQISQGNIPLTQTEYLQTFTNFDVIDGTIDSIKYEMNSTADTITIISYVSSRFSGKRKLFASTAQIHLDTGSAIGAFNCSKEVTMKGNAEIVGDLNENITMNFVSTFEHTMAEMKAMADHYYKNPKTSISPITGITYVELTGNKSLHMSGNWSGDGILIVDGNFKDTGQADFDGVMWVEGGSFQMSGQSDVEGAIFVNTTDTVKLSGNSYVEYNETIVSSLITIPGGTSADTIETLSWDN
ncbi:MAG: hypothetical protein K9N09_06465 [Candidatus Cloacimonetes bacterium]|nr:hypothetical protein [Candidatus Cloacimonadota bacterium]MCF7813650.1 hypothetical protein [Candidatus Cloacimonadota bacterium]MCF7868329.1 hypothetical protein [Candidatus Cloacimonadota bacterium]MCF7883803.1 hypothetical protein [Candidatus Cloacimonadota bacterium]